MNQRETVIVIEKLITAVEKFKLPIINLISLLTLFVPDYLTMKIFSKKKHNFPCYFHQIIQNLFKIFFLL